MKAPDDSQLNSGHLNCSPRQRPVCYLYPGTLALHGYERTCSGDQVIISGTRYELISWDPEETAWTAELAAGKEDSDLT